MTTSSSHPHSSFRAALMGVVAFWAVACGGSTSPGNGSQGVHPGDPCSTGAQAKAADGCNSCTCENGAWACTDMACPTPGAGGSGAGGGGADGGPAATGGVSSACTPGATMTSGCNSCVCQMNGWMCTNLACPPPACTDGTTMYDGCNTCTCMNGQWGCTTKACPPPPPPPPPACTNGSAMYDGCNTCTCVGGQWVCTQRACPTPMDAGPALRVCGARAGNTCLANEYCAYQPGEYCGGADAESVCMPRPDACTEQYDPVCGCDGMTYSNACFANSAGTGVMSTGPCFSAN